MYKFTLEKLFCLDGLLIDKYECSDNEICLYVRSPRTRAICPLCDARTKRIHRTAFRSIKHMMHDDKIVSLKLRARNFKCKKCGHIFRETVSGVSRRNTTAHFRQAVVKKIYDRSFSSVAREHKVSVSSLVRSATEISEQAGLQWPKEKFALGMDGHSFSGHDMVATLTNLSKHQLIGILPDYDKNALSFCLQNIPKTSKNLITSVCIDMHEGSRAVIEECLPNTPIVVDKFHVIQLLNKNLMQMRSTYTRQAHRIPKKLFEKNREDLTRAEKQILNRILKSFPTISDMWHLKEWFRTFYRLKNSKKAKARYTAMLQALAEEVRPRWKTLYKTLNRWKEYILNYFEYRITNAYTEGIHTRIKLLKRISYGFRNKQNYIAKMILAFLPFSLLLNYIYSSPSLT